MAVIIAVVCPALMFFLLVFVFASSVSWAVIWVRAVILIEILALLLFADFNNFFFAFVDLVRTVLLRESSKEAESTISIAANP